MRHHRLAFSLLVAAALLVLGAPLPAAAETGDPPPRGGVSGLWKAYPLEPDRPVSPQGTARKPRAKPPSSRAAKPPSSPAAKAPPAADAPPAAKTRPAAPPRAERASSDDSRLSFPIALAVGVAAALASVAAGIVGAWTLRRRRASARPGERRVRTVGSRELRELAAIAQNGPPTPAQLAQLESAGRQGRLDERAARRLLEALDERYEELRVERDRLRDLASALETEAAGYRDLEIPLPELLAGAERHAEEERARAREEARATLEEAQADGDEIARTAEARRAELEREIGELEGARRELEARCRAFLASAKAWLEGEDAARNGPDGSPAEPKTPLIKSP